MFETLRQDVRHGARILMRDPGFALVAILSIAIGVAVVVPLLAVTAACAAYVPARRASRIDPLAALRQD